MKIAMLARMLPRRDYAGGVSGQVHLLASELQRLGHDVTVFALNQAPAGSAYRSVVVPSTGCVPGRGLSLYAFPWRLSKLALDDFDVVHSHGDDHFVRTSRPLIRTFYGSSKAEGRFAETLRHRAYHLSMVIPEHISEWRATTRVAISTATLRYLSRPARIIPCGFDPSIFYPAEEKSVRPSVLFVGDLGTRKRAEVVLQAFRDTVRPAVPDAELWLVTAEATTGDGVRWFGRVDVEALADLYRRAWLFCLPSRYEGFGVPYIEAMACGTPIVATPNGGADDILAEGKGGRIVPDSSVGDTLAELLTDTPLRRSIAADAPGLARRYEVSRIADQYVCVYREALVGT
jgi:phosphatidyl-myo-inositol alpha-mannosyltransferase